MPPRQSARGRMRSWSRPIAIRRTARFSSSSRTVVRWPSTERIREQRRSFCRRPIRRIRICSSRTDAGDVVFENSAEANNYAEAGNLFDVTPAPFADLAVSAVSAPANGGSGQSLEVTWTVVNQSPHAIGTTSNGEWGDSVYLASDPAGKNIVAGVGSFNHVGTWPLAAAIRARPARSSHSLLPAALITSSSTPAGRMNSSIRTTTAASRGRWR